MKDLSLSIKKSFGLLTSSIKQRSRSTMEQSGIENLSNISSQVQEDIKDLERWFLMRTREISLSTILLLSLVRLSNLSY